MLQVLGKGGFGIVFRAFDDVLQRVVAIKVMAPHMATTSPARKRFLREARSSAAVRHENIVQVHEVGEEPLPYLVMEFIPGETPQQKLDRCGPLDVPEVLRIGRQIAEGLAAAHACDLIHRDIKPGNVLLEGGPHKVKITDFGLARSADDASISQSGIIAGTPNFMAPEQALGHTIDQRADLFSLGSVLYQMVSGRPPFRAPSTLAVLKRVAEEAPRPIREIIPETPDWLCAIIAKLHTKNPDDRFQSAREVADLLAHCEAKLSAKQEVGTVLPGARRGGRRWVAAAAVLLLPLIALAGMEFTGVTNLFRGQASDASKPGGEVPPVEVAKKDTPAPVSSPEPPPLAVAPFDAAQAKARQEAWAKHLGVPVEIKNSLGMTFRLIPPGEFPMGIDARDVNTSQWDFPSPEFENHWQAAVAGASPKHRVTLTRAFYIQTHEVRHGWYRELMGAIPEIDPDQDPDLSGTKVSYAGLLYLKGLPLTGLSIFDTGISDLTPLQGMPLEDFRLTPKNITRGLGALRAMKTLNTIGISSTQFWPAAEFWARYDKGEFRK